MAVLAGQWSTTGTMPITPFPLFPFSSPQLEESTNAAQPTQLTEHITSELSSSLWRGDREVFLDGNKSTISSVMSTVGFSLQMLMLNETQGAHMETGMGTSAPTVSSELDIMGFPFSTLSEEDAINNDSSLLTTPSTAAANSQSGFPGRVVIVPLYTLIFILSFIGNLMVILTLARNRRMRTVTNILLLNLVS